MISQPLTDGNKGLPEESGSPGRGESSGACRDGVFRRRLHLYLRLQVVHNGIVNILADDAGFQQFVKDGVLSGFSLFHTAAASAGLSGNRLRALAVLIRSLRGLFVRAALDWCLRLRICRTLRGHLLMTAAAGPPGCLRSALTVLAVLRRSQGLAAFGCLVVCIGCLRLGGLILRLAVAAGLLLTVSVSADAEFSLALGSYAFADTGASFRKTGSGTLTLHAWPGINPGIVTVAEGAVNFAGNGGEAPGARAAPVAVQAGRA